MGEPLRKYIFFYTAIFLTLFILIEILGYLYTSTSLGKSFFVEVPTYEWKNIKVKFWEDVDERFGVWHVPKASYRHKKTCFDARYVANSYGARDVERTRLSDKKRVVVLGDSFIEGNGVNSEDRLTNLLEKKTGTEHLNFASSGGFGTIAYYLVYKHLASKFSHTDVLINILPYNDFNDNDFEYGKNNKSYSKMYRPYLVGEYPNYELIYHPPNPELVRFQRASQRDIFWLFRRTLGNFSYSYSLARNLYWLMQFWMNGRYSKSMENHIQESGYYTYSEKQFDLMKYTLEEMKKEANGKKMTILLTPRLHDIRLYHDLGLPPLSKDFEELAANLKVQIIDLLPHMHDYDTSWEKYFLPCDGHWSPYGNKVASNYLINKLR